MKDNKHLIVKEYLKGHSLVESNITSFNRFIDTGMQEIVDEISAGIDKEELK